MTMRRTLQFKLDQLLAILTDTAVNGRPCPSNYVLAEKIHVGSPPYVSELIRLLRTDGLIETDRAGGNRRIKVLSTGDWTEWTDQSTQRRAARILHPKEKLLGELDKRRFIVRDPCTYCGTRREIGCRHYPLEQVAA